MSRRLNYDELNTPTLPRISKGAWQFGTRVYLWRCTGRLSTGYGTTPADAYAVWKRNWSRRLKWWAEQTARARRTLSKLGM